jgi:hypothetical protein
MNRFANRIWLSLGAALLLGAGTFSAYPTTATAAALNLTPSGAQEVPPVKSAGSGSGTLTINADHSVSGRVTTTGIAGTMAHIHEAPAGRNGPVIIPLTQNGDTYTVPAGAKLTDAQYASFQAGNLYVNVHTAAYPGGELRAQLKP